MNIFLIALNYTAPLPQRNYLPPSTSYGTPDFNSISTPTRSSYDPPAAGIPSGYSEDEDSIAVNAPSNEYGPPSNTLQTPQSTYAAPSSQYGPPSNGNRLLLLNYKITI